MVPAVDLQRHRGRRRAPAVGAQRLGLQLPDQAHGALLAAVGAELRPAAGVPLVRRLGRRPARRPADRRDDGAGRPARRRHPLPAPPCRTWSGTTTTGCAACRCGSRCGSGPRRLLLVTDDLHGPRAAGIVIAVLTVGLRQGLAALADHCPYGVPRTWRVRGSQTRRLVAASAAVALLLAVPTLSGLLRTSARRPTRSTTPPHGVDNREGTVNVYAACNGRSSSRGATASGTVVAKARSTPTSSPDQTTRSPASRRRRASPSTGRGRHRGPRRRQREPERPGQVQRLRPGASCPASSCS